MLRVLARRGFAQSAAPRTYPGAPHARFTGELSAALPPEPHAVLPVFRVVDADGGVSADVSEDTRTRIQGVETSALVALLRSMVKLRALDGLCLQAHRQGRVPFYAPSSGEEVRVRGPAHARVRVRA